MLSEWSGENKEKLIQELDMVKIMVKNKHLEWYFHNIHPNIQKLIAKEVHKTEFEQLPMTEYLFRFIKK